MPSWLRQALGNRRQCTPPLLRILLAPAPTDPSDQSLEQPVGLVCLVRQGCRLEPVCPIRHPINRYSVGLRNQTALSQACLAQYADNSPQPLLEVPQDLRQGIHFVPPPDHFGVQALDAPQSRTGLLASEHPVGRHRIALSLPFDLTQRF